MYRWWWGSCWQMLRLMHHSSPQERSMDQVTNQKGKSGWLPGCRPCQEFLQMMHTVLIPYPAESCHVKAVVGILLANLAADAPQKSTRELYGPGNKPKGMTGWLPGCRPCQEVLQIMHTVLIPYLAESCHVRRWWGSCWQIWRLMHHSSSQESSMDQVTNQKVRLGGCLAAIHAENFFK